jgi:ABC-type branched-subunit amino acid transport system substrate-binding protein
VGAFLFKGHALYELDDLIGAAESYVNAIDINPRDENAKIAKSNLDPLIKRGLSLWELKQLIDDNPGSTLREELELTLASRQVKSNRFRSGASTLRSYLQKFPYGKYSKNARRMLADCEAKLTGSQIIGLMAPITGGFSEYGRSMVEGARLAVKLYSEDDSDVELIIKDTEGDAVRTAKVAKKLANEEALAVVGPLRSESAVGAAVILNDNEIPMITPTASQKGIANVGNYIFQISPAIERMGQAMAAYAINNLGIKEFAILAPDDLGGVTVAKAFSQTVYRLGGEVVYSNYYNSTETDFKGQIKPLREVLLMKTEEQLTAGELDSTEYIEVEEFIDVFGNKTDSIAVIDKEDWPVHLGGLFLPGYSDELKMLIPQIRYHIIRTQFLGGDGWDSEELINEVRRYVGDAVFATDFHAGSDDVDWVEFSNAYMQEYNHRPDKVAALTFDAVALIMDGLQKGHTEPEKLRDYLSGLMHYNGVSCLITFKGNNRANNEVRIYSIDGDKIAVGE